MFEELRPCLGYVSPGFENLKISGFLGLPVQLDFPGLPKALGRLAVELKETATQFSYQIAFIFCSNETVRGYLKSPVDIAKLLVFHVLEHNPHLLLEQRKWLPMDRLQKARTVPDFLGILKDILRFIPSILFIIDSIDSYALSTVPEDQVQDTKNDIKQLSDGLNNLAQIYDNSVKIITPTTPLQSKRSSTANLSSGGLTTKLQLSGGMISWTEGGKREEFPLPRFRNQAFIMHTASALEELSDDEEVAPREPSDNEAFLKMTTPEGGSISAGTLPTGFTLPKRPSWPSNLYSIDRHKCKFQECYNPHTNERTLTTAKFPLMSGGW
ncbi:hypothetical protein L873DRAFT_1807733 [Choiromyces venosus 120613-1]|uniref:Uncharacterized protein n=1 Tax=Choiromyces venosus 120613-1 TaxID=1336337 RepID=A0A3N4JP11_9PEZI|nr:hypothetical protein L873DRAFT_1807733 [Choiromyces venosus 120613-1]